MANERRRSGRRNTRPRVLFTGCGVRMIDNLAKHVSNDFEPEKCPAGEDDFGAALKRFSPHMVVICLQDEYSKDLNTYYILEDDPLYKNMPLLVIGRDEDCELFRKKIHIDHAIILGRPLNMDLFLPTLEKMAEDALAIEQEEEEIEESSKAEQNLEEKIQRTKNEERKSILVVDDDVRMLNVIKLYLEDLYDVTVVPSGKLALKFLEKKHADLVLLDYLMPEMDGPKVLEQMRTSSFATSVPVLFLTGVNDKDMVMKTLDLNPNGYLLKPASREIILERVTEILLGL